MEFALTPEALFWLKVAGWLFIGGCASWVLGRIWGDEKKDPSEWDKARKREREREER